MSAGEVVVAIIFFLVVSAIAWSNVGKPPRASRMAMASWAASVRERGLPPEEYLKEARLMRDDH